MTAQSVFFADGFDEPEIVAFGLAAPQLAAVVACSLSAWALVRAPGPAALDDAAAGLIGIAAVALGWGRVSRRPLLSWAWLVLRYLMGPGRHGRPRIGRVGTRVSEAGVTLAAGEVPEVPEAQMRRRGPSTSPAGPGGAGDKEPAWTRWLRGPGEGGASEVCHPAGESDHAVAGHSRSPTIPGIGRTRSRPAHR